MATQQNSRLGQILLNKGLISPDQLAQAIQLQAKTHKRLGEILIEQGLVSERQLSRALKKQSSLRIAATLVAALLSPFQMASADLHRQPPSSVSRTLQPLSDSEMGDVSAQGLDDVLQGLFLQAESGDGLGTAGKLAKLVMPVLNSLEAETSMKDVRYDTSKLTSVRNPDGSLNVRLPSSIGELRFDNVRVLGADKSQSMGSVTLQDIDLSQASLRISLRP